MIEAKNLTLKYSSGKGVFGLNFKVGKGEVAGYLGPNGAGKTTTIRQLMGFMQPESGSCTIGGRDCFGDAPEIQRTLGYIPGEIAFTEGMNGDEYLKFIMELRGNKDTTRQKQLIDMFEFSPKGGVKKFSKGMKQKLGIVAAFMHNPDVLILDEPTSGLDPLMQNRFIELILEEKKRGKTILMSSHIFEEIERTCDNVLIIKEGRIVAQSDIATLKSSQRKGFIVKTHEAEAAAKAFTAQGFEITRNGDSIEVYIKGDSTDKFVKALGSFTVSSLDAKAQTLEDVFMHYYKKEGKQ